MSSESKNIKNTEDIIDEEEVARNIYRFSGYRYQLQAPPCYGPDDVIQQVRGLYPYPKSDHQDIQ